MAGAVPQSQHLISVEEYLEGDLSEIKMEIPRARLSERTTIVWNGN